MTCVVGIVKDGRAIVAADSLSTSGDHIVARDFTKVIRRHAKVEEMNGISYRSYVIVMGFAGDARTMQAIQYAVDDPPMITQSSDVPTWIGQKFIPWMKSCAAEASGDSEDSDIEVVISMRGRLFWVMSNWSFNEILDHCASGTGRAYAMGALHATRRMKDPEKRAAAAVAAAVACSTSVSGQAYSLETTRWDGAR